MRTITETRLQFERQADYPWNVQLWSSTDGGKTFVYTGNGKFFKGDQREEMYDYIRDNRTPICVFPLITPERQQCFEKEMGEKVPDICGICGRACWRMGDRADRAICINCPLSEYAHKLDMMEYATK